MRERVLPFFRWGILPEIHKGKTVFVSASGNSMRPILQLLDHLDNATTAMMEVGLCTPYIYYYEGEKLLQKEVRDVPGIITKGASQTEATVKEGRV